MYTKWKAISVNYYHLHLLTFIIVLFYSVNGYSQVLQGTVKNLQGSSVEGVHIINMRTQNHSHTNHLGKFRSV